MKCPHCDAEMSAQKKCGKCGFEVADDRDEVEVEYKDFKTSELLEIRHKKLADRKHAEIKTVGEHNGGKALKRELSGETFCKEEKKPFPFFAAMALILLLIAGVFFIFRYFIMR